MTVYDLVVSLIEDYGIKKVENVMSISFVHNFFIYKRYLELLEAGTNKTDARYQVADERFTSEKNVQKIISKFSRII